MKLRIEPEVQAALVQGGAVVALESTVIAHGLPYPENLALAARMEAHVRDGGAVPATIAVAGGEIRVGLDPSLREALATRPGVAKVSLRDLAIVLAEGTLGATTVASTLWAAHRAGVRVFATGGIGGVHPGGDDDISADLPALATIPVAVVSSGAKAICDLARTREWLETWGVPILGWKTGQMPAFFSQQSGLDVDRRVEDEAQAARLIGAHLELGRGAILIGSPVPTGDEVPQAEMLAWIEAARAYAHAEGVTGHALTPFLLRELSERSLGRTLRANLALLENNARVAARIAVALSQKRAD